MGISLHYTSSRTRHDIKKQWYGQLKTLVSNIDEIPDRPVLGHEEQQRLGIRMLSSSAEAEDAQDSEAEPRYFTPVLPENLPISPCCPSRWPVEHGVPTHKPLWPRPIPYDEDAAELVDDYIDARFLASDIAHHASHLRWDYPSPWKQTSYGEAQARGARGTEHTGREERFLVCNVFNTFSKRRPHQILLMAADHPAEENSLLRSEVLVMASFMRWKMLSMQREQSLVYPVMVITIMNLMKVRMLQGHFDGTLKIRQSKMYDFAVEDHESAMKVVVGWLRSMAHGDTTLSMQLPIFQSESHNEDEMDEDKDRKES
ncbi:hypothetical protein FQN50_000360 [Emmonsiellopsis sp. PD_5]|nr:hypothetical protein FQN50_000360 [Emmonsiellopsis sp. PD_5]